MKKTKIEWTDCTWNFITGCTQISPACDNCYAKAMTKRLQGMAKKPIEKKIDGRFFIDKNGIIEYITPDECVTKRIYTPKYYYGWDKVVFHEKYLEDILDKKKYPSGSKVFVNSMSDTFHENISYSDLQPAFAYTSDKKDLIFQFLTKRPKNMIKFFEDFMENFDDEWGGNYSKILDIIPLNCWFGVTAENQKMADERIPELLKMRELFEGRSKNLILFVSVEPMLEAIDLRKYLLDLDWVIVGGENAPKSKTRPMNIEWVRDLYEQCKKYNIPFFFKQWGNYYELNSSSIADIKEFPKIDEQGKERSKKERL